MPGGPIFLVMIVLLVGAIFFLRPALFQTLQEAWAVDSSLQNFREVEGDLKDQARYLALLSALSLMLLLFSSLSSFSFLCKASLSLLLLSLSDCSHVLLLRTGEAATPLCHTPSADQEGAQVRC
jgi:hypothetical protein